MPASRRSFPLAALFRGTTGTMSMQARRADLRQPWAQPTETGT